MSCKATYKSGDSFLASAQGRSNQFALFLDSTGRVYSCLAQSLPSARGQGEPLSGRFRLPDGAEFSGAMIGGPEDRYLVSSDSGYGFIVKLADLNTRNKAGKAILRLPIGGKPILPALVPKDSGCLIVAVSSAGRLLCFSVDLLPQLAKGKGLKIINIHAASYKAGEEKLVASCVIQEGKKLHIHTPSRTMTIKWKNLELYLGDRARRGQLLPKGWRKVDRLSTEID